ncbi:MAG: alpha/beta fold hydrolase [Thermomicrobiales bacterium]
MLANGRESMLVEIDPVRDAVGGMPMDPKPTFVLIHGAWHGGWCWQRLAPMLRAAGYETYTPTLTGLGERAHLLNPAIDLSTHITDVLNLLEYDDLSDVILVGHSYGGMVVSALVEQVPDRIAQAIYLDAFLPENGESIRDIGTPGLDEIAATYGDGWRMPPTMPAADFGVSDPDDAAWVDARIGDQPYGTFTQPITLTGAGESIPKAFILCTEFLFPPHAERARQRGFVVRDLKGGGHDCMVTIPDQLATMLLELATSATHQPAVIMS